MTLLLSNTDAEKLLTLPDFIPVLEDAYRELAHGRGVSRTTSESFAPTEHAADALYTLKTMDGIIPKFGVSAIRLSSDIMRWPRDEHGTRNVKAAAAPGGRFVGLVLLFSTTTGEPLAIMPDGFIQRVRVGAAGALGVKYLARENAETIGMIGTGNQAVGQLAGACAVRAIKSARCYSPNAGNRTHFAREMTKQLGIPVTAVDSAEAAVSGVDIVLCATNSYGPIFFDKWLTPGMHVSSIKLPEIAHDAVRRADKVAVHSRDTTSLFFSTVDAVSPKMKMNKADAPGDKLNFKALPTLPEMIAGVAPARTSDTEITCFLNNMGLGYQFAAAGWLIYTKAKAQGLGRELPTEWFTEDLQP